MSFAFYRNNKKARLLKQKVKECSWGGQSDRAHTYGVLKASLMADLLIVVIQVKVQRPVLD